MGRSSAGYRREYGLVAFGALSYTCLMFVWFSLPAYLSVIIDDVGLSSTQAGILTGAVPLTYIPLALFSGIAVDRIGPGRSLAAGVLIYGIAQIARSFAPGFPSLFAVTLLLGVGATAITFGLPKLVGVLFPPEKTGRPSAIYLVGASTGSALVFAVGRPILGPWLGGWRPLFFWSGVVAVAYGLVWTLVTHRAGIDGRMAVDDSFSLESVVADLRLVLSHRELQLVVVIGTMYLLLNHGLQGWLPTLLESRGLAAGPAGQTTSLLVASYVVGVLAVPELADRYGLRRPALMACGAVAFCGVAGVIAGGTGPLVLTGIVVTGIGVGGISPLVRAIPPDLEGIGARLTGTAVGFIFAVGEIGGFFGPVLIGALRDATGSFAPGLAILAGGALVVVVAGATLQRLAH
ncbi:major facilitator superfamily MFS_1 [Haloterrigena turkmenica DSM 5511]|uniref:Major facilitator superfamily MFS_1 n=1 Tax=Haloterrigena turkmenica (strain ATCC 51198 / DSM 5511 / JCM 9101 / NCIMB 13204 / VKM B-1734 / 4k) TaxID=543526 RepID=D2RQ86_HALTV|nr:MFS transporter [Haloterrigena turkmenica]ADB62263.1 major facilitator superfamily MFS_1 [Haloterrigena turkmenica DSM 5511]